MSDERIPVVQYVRMSTDHQRYSTANQRAAIEAYAERHGMIVVGTFEDQGKSGLYLDSRIALQELLGIVKSGSAKFKAILVYDVSRWGRFQNPDEGAYYEYLCAMAGVKVIFCAEPFENDGSPLGSVVKSLKRSMAAEFSRELSLKVFAGQCRLARMGFRQGGPPGYGLKRVLLDEAGCYKADLARGERKSLQSDRVILAPGPSEEVKVVRRIYRDFIERHMTEKHIAEALNREGLTLAPGRPWRQGTIHKVLVW
jgi:DNA invertase Pin-like site-specific DNA recombinase